MNIINFEKPKTRRKKKKKIIKFSGCLTLAGTATGSPEFVQNSIASKTPAGFLIEAIGETEGYDVKQLTRKTFEAAGGISKFISKGDVVAIKPNISWARRPEMAASTNPYVLQAVIELCQEAGANKVRIADHTIHDARRCFALTGAGMVAKNTGADLIYPRSSLMRRMKLQGNRLDIWPVFVPLVEADKVINLPVAKHHSLSSLTLGMKNWIGAVGGRRNKLHQDIHMTIVDLAQFFNPTLTLIDGIFLYLLIISRLPQDIYLNYSLAFKFNRALTPHLIMAQGYCEYTCTLCGSVCPTGIGGDFRYYSQR